ncbi:MAG: septum formation initiator family protein [Proteiniphilum sp.]|jgi:cell division protein FtsB|nr:septum formation initiator family protein [Proteiniphilum sp.]
MNRYINRYMKKFGSGRTLGLTSWQIVILVVLIAALFFFSDSSISKRMKYESQIIGLESQIEFYRRQAEADGKKLRELRSNTGDLEKFARENYLMKRKNEEIFIIKERKGEK